VFELTPSGMAWTETVLLTFDGTNGENPQAPLIFDNAGNLYGTTFTGGPEAGGVVFELTPKGGAWLETILHAFPYNTSDGNTPQAAPVIGASGNLFGTTVQGGADDWGVVYEIVP